MLIFNDETPYQKDLRARTDASNAAYAAEKARRKAAEKAKHPLKKKPIKRREKRKGLKNLKRRGNVLGLN